MKDLLVEITVVTTGILVSIWKTRQIIINITLTRVFRFSTNKSDTSTITSGSISTRTIITF